MQPLVTARAVAIKRCITAAFTSSPRSYTRLSHRPTQHYRLAPAQWSRPTLRYSSSLVVPESEAVEEPTRPDQPSYQITFTCKPCGHRHVISDHLNIFMDEKSTLEDILKRTAGTDQDLSKLLKKGKLGLRGNEIIGRDGEQDLEFWDDGSETKHTPAHAMP